MKFPGAAGSLVDGPHILKVRPCRRPRPSKPLPWPSRNEKTAFQNGSPQAATPDHLPPFGTWGLKRHGLLRYRSRFFEVISPHLRILVCASETSNDRRMAAVRRRHFFRASQAGVVLFLHRFQGPGVPDNSAPQPVPCPSTFGP